MNHVSSSIERRALLRGVAATGAALAGGSALAACGSSTPTGSGGSATTSTGAGAGSAGDVLVAAAEVPDGGGVILSEAAVVITQPKAGEYKGFSSICTHQGCPVADVADGTINCDCHGSMFSIEDGSVVGGPAPAPLPSVDVTVDGDNVVRA